LAGVEAGGIVISVEEVSVTQGERFRAAPATASALAYRFFLHQPVGTFYCLCSVLDGFSRFLVHWDLRESMREADVEVILERAKEKYPEARPRIISDDGPQFIARDFKEFIRISGMTHVRTSPYYPQSNGKIERWHKSLKSECIRPGTPLSLDDALRLVRLYVEHYNTIRLNSAHRLHHSEGYACRPTRSRFTLSGTASRKPPDSNVTVAASKLREERSGQPPRCRIAVLTGTITENRPLVVKTV
jgi:hypothetical protein